ncbi:hypothetical protein GIB67_022631 [Kingdonia uniflora]|uniref:Uncharacterized protein n=1 Tax=Kingdonia uniflora TaxID=39325 RepID=A0A7J7P872_9MAGN|nr:hypothetical protein GIB67_022631 [Kingdonia uniflora]
MAVSGSAYADVMEIPACAVGTLSSLVRRPRVKKTVPPSEPITPVQLPPVGTKGVVTDVNMAPPLKMQKKESEKDIRAFSKGVNLEAVEQEALDLATRDPIRLDTQIRSSISQISVAWKSAAEFEQEKVLQREQFEKEKVLQREQFEKEVAATKQEVEDEVKKAVNIAVASQNKLIQAFYVLGLSKEDVDLALAGKYGEIVFPGDDASQVDEQTPALPVDDDPTKEVEDKKNNNVVALSSLNKKLSAKLQQCSLAAERKTLLNSKLESEMLELQSRLNVVTVELSCKDAKILTANNSVIANNTDLLKKQDYEIRYMRERLKKLNYDLREARDSCQRKKDRAKTHEEACSKRDRDLNEAINKCNSRIAALDRNKQALLQEYIQGNKFFEELHARYKESQRMMDAAEAEINYSREVDNKFHRLKQEMECSVQITKQYRGSLLQEKKSLEAQCKDLDDELNKVKAEFYEPALLTAENVTFCAMAMLHVDVEKFRTERDSILAVTTEYVAEFDLQLAQLSYIDNLMLRVIILLNAPSTVVDAAIPSPSLLSFRPGESSNVDCPKREQ